MSVTIWQAWLLLSCFEVVLGAVWDAQHPQVRTVPLYANGAVKEIRMI